MTTKRVPQRNEIEKKYTWNSESLFASDAAWEAELGRLMDAIAALSAFEGAFRRGRRCSSPFLTSSGTCSTGWVRCTPMRPIATRSTCATRGQR